MNISANLAQVRATSPADEGVGPSQVMEVALHVLVFGLLGVSIIGIAFVYGFNVQTGSFLDNTSAAIRALGVDGGFFLGLYFSRRLWMRKKHGWWDGLKTTLFGGIWFGVALLMASLSWFSNTLFVTSFQTIITQDLLGRAGFGSIPPELVNKAIGAIPLVIVLLYSIVPRQTQVQIETRTPEEIEQEAKQEAARIRAQNLVAAAKAEGAGQRLRTIVGGLVGEALNLEERNKRDERRKQMRIALETAGHDTADMNDEQVEIQAISRGVWDQKRNEATIKAKPAARSTAASPAPAEATLGEGDEPPAMARSPEGETLSISDLAELLSVSRGTISNWMRPDAPEATRIDPEEVTMMPDGSRRIHPSVLPRLKRAQTAKRSASPTKSRPSQGRLPAVSAPITAYGNGKRQAITNPLDLPKMNNPDNQHT